MGNYTILQMFENPRRGRQARNFTTNVPKILVLKSSSEQIFSRKLPLGAPDQPKKRGHSYPKLSRANLQASETEHRCKRVLVSYQIMARR